jgi:hypothetical protein
MMVSSLLMLFYPDSNSKGIFAMLAKILGNVRIYLLCALLKGMRFRSRRYLCWRRCRLPQRMYNTSRRLLLAAADAGQFS